ncbi:hypothetical protein ACPSKX_09090 [Moritella viscosa]
MVSDEQRALIQEIATADSLGESIAIFSLTKELLDGCKFIFASDSGPSPGLSVGQDFKDGSAIRSLFSTEKVLVLDNETLRDMSLGTAEFQIDYSISLDTQALSYLEPYISGNVNKLPMILEIYFNLFHKITCLLTLCHTFTKTTTTWVMKKQRIRFSIN